MSRRRSAAWRRMDRLQRWRRRQIGLQCEPCPASARSHHGGRSRRSTHGQVPARPSLCPLRRGVLALLAGRSIWDRRKCGGSARAGDSGFRARRSRRVRAAVLRHRSCPPSSMRSKSRSTKSSGGDPREGPWIERRASSPPGFDHQTMTARKSSSPPFGSTAGREQARLLGSNRAVARVRDRDEPAGRG